MAMPLAPGSRAVRPRLFQLNRRLIAMICLAVAAGTAASSFALGSPLTRAWPPAAGTDWLPFIGGALPLLAMLVSAAGLFGSRKAVAAGAGDGEMAETGMQDLR